jgi:parallel beta-helix repeat protein
VCVVMATTLSALWAGGAEAKKAKLPSEQVFRGQAIDHSLRVANNLEDCPAEGLIVGADDITIDLRGHRIAGTGVSGSVGIDNTAGHSGVKVRNGVVLGFEVGVYLSGATNNVVSGLHLVAGLYGLVLESSSDGNTVKANTAFGNTINGIALFSSSENDLIANTASRNASVGIHISSGSHGNTLEANAAWSNVGAGIRISSSSDNIVTGSTSSGNADGLSLDFASTNVVKGSTASGNRDDGISLTLSSGNSLRGNIAEGNAGNGVYLDGSSSNVLKGNMTSANDGAGIDIFSSPDNVLLKNKAHENGSDGISSDTAALTLTDNKALGNGFLGGPPDADGTGLGIDVPAGTTNSGNKAGGNDDSDECEAPDVNCEAPGAGSETKLPAELVFCGQTIDHSLRVANNLRNCVDDGLVIGADDITIDLGGHRIDGTGEGDDLGIDNTAGHDGVKVRNGVITGFEHGVHLVGVANNVISGLYVVGNTDHGLFLESSSHNTLKGNRVWTNGDDGISFDSTSDSTLKGNVAAGNSFHGIRLFVSDRNVLKGNTASANASGSGISASGSDDNTYKANWTFCNGDYGIKLFASDTSALTANTTSCNADDGIRIDGSSSGSTLESNRVTGNDDYGIFLDGLANSTVKANHTSANDFDGIRISGGSGYVVTKNEVHENGRHGISSSSSDLALKKNVANRNGFLGGPPDADGIGLGIDVPAGTTNAGNKAKGNDDPNECEAADVTSCHVP